jgi:hypothetical protein
MQIGLSSYEAVPFLLQQSQHCALTLRLETIRDERV